MGIRSAWLLFLLSLSPVNGDTIEYGKNVLNGDTKVVFFLAHSFLKTKQTVSSLIKYMGMPSI